MLVVAKIVSRSMVLDESPEFYCAHPDSRRVHNVLKALEQAQFVCVF